MRNTEGTVVKGLDPVKTAVLPEIVVRREAVVACALDVEGNKVKGLSNALF